MEAEFLNMYMEQLANEVADGAKRRVILETQAKFEKLVSEAKDAAIIASQERIAELEANAEVLTKDNKTLVEKIMAMENSNKTVDDLLKNHVDKIAELEHMNSKQAEAIQELMNTKKKKGSVVLKPSE